MFVKPDDGKEFVFLKFKIIQKRFDNKFYGEF